MSNCLLFPWVLPLRWSIQIFFYDNNLPGTCMFFIVDTTSIIIYGISLLSVVYKHFDILNLILFMPEEGKPETSWSKKQKRKVFGFHSIQVGGGKEFVVHVYPQNPLLWSIRRLPMWKFWNFREKKTPNRPNYFFDFPIIGPKKKCRKLYIWVSNTIRRKMQEQWKKN